MILEHFLNKLEEVLSTVWGWVMCLCLVKIGRAHV